MPLSASGGYQQSLDVPWLVNSRPHTAAKESEPFPSLAGQQSPEPPAGGLLTSPLPPCTHTRRKKGQRPCPGAKRRAQTTGQAGAQPSWQPAFSKQNSRPEGWPNVTGMSCSTPSLSANTPPDQAACHHRTPSCGSHRPEEIQEKAAITHQHKQGARDSGNGPLHSSGGQKSKVQVLAGPCPSEGSGGDVLASFSFWWLPAIPGCSLACE